MQNFSPSEREETRVLPDGDGETPAPAETKQPSAKEPNKVVRVEGNYESFRSSDGTDDFSKLNFQISEADREGLQAAFRRSKAAGFPERSRALPMLGSRLFRADEIIEGLQTYIEAQSYVDPQTSALLAYWALATWLPEARDEFPCLILSGDSGTADRILRTLSNLCRNSLLMLELNRTALLKIPSGPRYTLLINEPSLSRKMGSLVECATHIGYTTFNAEGHRVDFFGPKAIFVGDHPPSFFKPPCSLHITVHTADKNGFHADSKETGQTLRNQLLRYRCAYLGRVNNESVDVSSLPVGIREAAHSLAVRIVDAPELQADLLRRLAPAGHDRIAEKAATLEGVTLEATATIAGQGTTQVLVREIAAEVNRIHQERGETTSFSPEKVGHALKRLGLQRRRLGQEGNGLLLDRAMLAEIEKLKDSYFPGGLVCADAKPTAV